MRVRLRTWVPFEYARTWLKYARPWLKYARPWFKCARAWLKCAGIDADVAVVFLLLQGSTLTSDRNQKKTSPHSLCC